MNPDSRTNVRQTWLVARRELRERSRSKSFRASVLIMMLGVIAVIVLPGILSGSGNRKHVGFVGTTPSGVQDVMVAQAKATNLTLVPHEYSDRTAGEDAVRKRKVDVLVVNGRTLEWQRKPDERLRLIAVGAIQNVEVRHRAQALGISTTQLQTLLTPVVVDSVTLTSSHGATPGDETAALIMTVILFISISTYGSLVLSGVVEEKSSRVVEVLLARLPARNLLAGKVIGIGLLGLAQLGVTAAAALVATRMHGSIDLPAVRPTVLVWAIVWFVLGYSLYSMVFGALGSLASRPEDAQAVAAPVTVLMVLAYLTSFAAIGSPDTMWARVVSMLPITAPLSMPTRIAIGAAAWWEPFVAVGLIVVTIGLLVRLAGRLYERAVLRTGSPVGAKAAWRLVREG